LHRLVVVVVIIFLALVFVIVFVFIFALGLLVAQSQVELSSEIFVDVTFTFLVLFPAFLSVISFAAVRCRGRSVSGIRAEETRRCKIKRAISDELELGIVTIFYFISKKAISE